MDTSDETVDRLVAAADLALQHELFRAHLREQSPHRLRRLIIDMLMAVSDELVLDSVLIDKFKMNEAGSIDVFWRHRSKTTSRWTILLI